MAVRMFRIAAINLWDSFKRQYGVGVLLGIIVMQAGPNRAFREEVLIDISTGVRTR